MSSSALAWAFDQAIKRSSTKLLLLAIADCANSETFNAFPSYAYLVDVTGQNRKTVLQNIKRLIESGYIYDTGSRTGRTDQIIIYQLLQPLDAPLTQAAIRRIKRLKGKIGNRPKNGPASEEAQKGTETDPKTDDNGPENGQKEARKRDTEPRGTKKGTDKEPETASSADFDDVKFVMGEWNALAEQEDLNPLSSLTQKRTQAIREIIAEFGEAALREALDQIKASQYLRGKVKNWRVTFDWLIKPDNFVKVIEGQYADRDAPDDSPATECKTLLPDTVIKLLRGAGITPTQINTRFHDVGYDMAKGAFIVKKTFVRENLIQHHEYDLERAFGTMPEIIVEQAA